MAEYATVEIKGLDELQRKMEELPTKIAKKSLRAALRAGGVIIRNAIISLAPKDTGFLSEHFSMKLSIKRDELAGSIYIGPQGKIDYPAYASGAYNIRRIGSKLKKVGRIAVATVARFLEFGTSKMAKKPFITQGFETSKSAALDSVITEIKDAVNNVD